MVRQRIQKGGAIIIKQVVILVIVFLLGIIVGAGGLLCFRTVYHWVGEHSRSKELVLHHHKDNGNPHEGTRVSYPGKSIDYSSKFNAKNNVHLAAAQQVGLKSVPQNRAAVENMKDRLVHVGTTKNYVVEPLTHSVPYLRPNAAKELGVIGEGFADILARNNLPHYQFIVTSVLRTQEDVNKLRKSGNINASANSAHCYGTTFDITYKRFEKAEHSDTYMTEENLKLVLGQVLLNEQRAGNIYVKYEYKQACFHITCRK